MVIQDVVVLSEAVADLESGYSFYKQKEHGIGTYFLNKNRYFSDSEKDNSLNIN